MRLKNQRQDPAAVRANNQAVVGVQDRQEILNKTDALDPIRELQRGSECFVLRSTEKKKLKIIIIMSCNGCRVLRKGCSESCILRPCLQWIENSDAQGHATVFVAKFFGRAGLMGFISAVPDVQRPALFQSLLYEACGRTVNPVFGAVGLLGTGNWQLCQAAVETVLKGGSLRPPHPLKLSSSLLPQGLQSSTRLENPVATNEIWDSGIQNVLPSHPSPKLFNGHEFHNSKSSLEGMGFFFFFFQRAHEGHKEQKNVHSGVRGDLNGSTCTTAQELQQQRMAQGNAPHLSTWPGAVGLVRFCPSKDQTNSLQVKGEQALGMSSYKQMDAAMEGGMSECLNHSIQIIAPVARRVKPCLRAAQHANGKAVPKSEPQEIFAAGLVSYGNKHQPELELDLTLKVQDAKGDSPATGFRVTSPSCESVISEGSVTSHSRQVVQSQPLISSWAQIERPSPAVVPPPLYHKLLPLLS